MENRIGFLRDERAEIAHRAVLPKKGVRRSGCREAPADDLAAVVNGCGNGGVSAEGSEVEGLVGVRRRGRWSQRSLD